jgi:hypothetical protein
MKPTKQRLGIDYFGTLNKDVDLMRRFLEKLMASGVEVYIISGASSAQLKALLPANSFSKDKHYTAAISIEDFFKQRGFSVSYRMDGSYYLQEDKWWRAKSEICSAYVITTMVDNEFRFKKYFDHSSCSTRFLLNSFAFSYFVRDYLSEKKEEENEDEYYTEHMYPYNINPIIPC